MLVASNIFDTFLFLRSNSVKPDISFQQFFIYLYITFSPNITQKGRNIYIQYHHYDGWKFHKY